MTVQERILFVVLVVIPVGFAVGMFGAGLLRALVKVWGN